MSRQRVAITGLGVVNPFGGDRDDFFARIAAGESAIRYMVTDDQPRPLALPAVQCTSFNAADTLGKPLASSMDRFSQLGTAAAFEAWQQAKLPRQPGEGNPDYGVSWGTALGGTGTFEQGYRDLWLHGRERLSPLSVVLGMNNAAAAHISMQLGLGNSSLSYTVACASAAAAIGEGYQRIRNGQASVMLTGGSDATLSYGVVRAWEALRVLADGDAASASRACRPFSSDRSGFVLGEGAAALVLENWDHAIARKAPILAELVGYGSTSDCSHLVRPAAAGQVRAIQLALADAGLSPDEIDYVNAHGTATREGDPTEIQALRTVFGERAAELAVSATKSMHGHMMGATGAVEALLTVMALQHDTLPPTASLDTVDPACAGVRHITGTALRGSHPRAALSNSFAFGGSNVVLAFRPVS